MLFRSEPRDEGELALAIDELLVNVDMNMVLFGAVAGLVLITILVFILFMKPAKTNRELKDMKKKYFAVTRDVEHPNVLQLLEQVSVESIENAETLAQVQESLKDLAKKQTTNISRIAIEHYNAFDFTYGELSFSVALLDDLGSGIVFTNIHNRDDARCYCKRVVNGTSKHPLSDEEKSVLEQAINGTVSYSRRDKGNE